MLPRILVAALALLLPLLVEAQQKEPRAFLPPPFDEYFRLRVSRISNADWSGPVTPENWPAKQTEMRQQLRQMLGLDPLPERTALQTVITGTVQGDGYVVDKLYFQSLPRLYVTANCYHPTDTSKRLPAVLCVCGHARVEENGIALGNKTNYEPHASWYARHGYVCLVIDTIELGEIRGEHHGTYSGTRMWWAARGYTPAGVETWNGMRAVDYLLSRPDVDPSRIGVTGRSGGGAYSWYIAAVDERIAAAAPTAGITTMKNHILDGTIEGHCDCMFMVNTERWDFDRVAALVAPRPLLIVNTDKDEIFPLDGVMEIYNKTRALYRKLGHEENIGLHLAEGPHADIQPLNTGEFHWMDRFLQGADRGALTDEPMYQRHKPAELRVFSKIPEDERVTSVDQWFGPSFTPAPPPATSEKWKQQRALWIDDLARYCFRSSISATPLDTASAIHSIGGQPWPGSERREGIQMGSSSDLKTQGIRLVRVKIKAAGEFQIPIWIFLRDGLRNSDLERVVINVLDDSSWEKFRAVSAGGFPSEFPSVQPDVAAWEERKKALEAHAVAIAYVCPRGVGPHGLAQLTPFKQRQILRRFNLIGESLQSGQVCDISVATSYLHALEGLRDTPLWVQADGDMAVNAVYASVLGPAVSRLELVHLPSTHWRGSIYLNVLRFLDIPQAVALVSESTPVAIYTDHPEEWNWPMQAVKAQGWDQTHLQLRPSLEAPR